MDRQGVRFCKDCANILYAQERNDEVTGDRSLVYNCRICDYVEVPKANSDYIVYHSDVKPKAEQMHTDYRDFILDPTYRRTAEVSCPKCGFPGAIMFYSENEAGDWGMQLTYVCSYREGVKKCGYTWHNLS